MNASTLVIVAVIVVLAFFAGRRMFAVYFGNKGCCGGGSTKPYAKKFANVTIEDTDESHYPYALELMIGGMTCCNCTRAVENAINSLPDVWATVDLESRKATVRSKQPLDQDAVESLVDAAGYYIIRLPKEAAEN